MGGAGGDRWRSRATGSLRGRAYKRPQGPGVGGAADRLVRGRFLVPLGMKCAWLGPLHHNCSASPVPVDLCLCLCLQEYRSGVRLHRWRTDTTSIHAVEIQLADGCEESCLLGV